MNIDDILEEVRLPRKTASLCLHGDLVARWAELHAEFKQAPEKASSLGEPSPRAALAKQLEALREQMAEHERLFTFEALPASEFSELLKAHPVQSGTERFNVETFPPALIARCAIDPQMTLDQAGRLLAKVSYAQRDQLFEAAWAVNVKAVDIPFDGSVYAETLADDDS